VRGTCMRWWPQEAGKIGGGLAFVAAAGLAGLILGWVARPVEKSLSVELPGDGGPEPDDPGLGASSLMFSTYPAYRLTSEAMFGYVPGAGPELPGALSEKAASSRAVAVDQRQASAPPSIRIPRDTSSLFNDAQIASIRSRLNLTPAQQPYWPSLEAALRSIHWRRSADKAGDHIETKSLDLDGEQVQRLTAAATPLMTKLRADQKEEVRTLLHLLGMEQLASGF
jgi:hypothetical protein